MLEEDAENETHSSEIGCLTGGKILETGTGNVTHSSEIGENPSTELDSGCLWWRDQESRHGKGQRHNTCAKKDHGGNSQVTRASIAVWIGK